MSDTKSPLSDRIAPNLLPSKERDDREPIPVGIATDPAPRPETGRKPLFGR